MSFASRCFILSMAFGLLARVSFSTPALPDAAPRSTLLFERTASGFQARSRNAAVRFERDRIDIQLRDTAMLAMRLTGRARRVDPQGTDPSTAKLHYRVGPQRDWRTDIDTFNKVVYPGVYRGVDLIFYGAGNQLEYDFVVQPGADPSAIQMNWEGGRKLILDGDGDLTVFAGGGQAHWKAPTIYQVRDGNRREIAGRFRLLSGNRVGFDVGEYDRSRELIIDPVLVFSTYLGGANMERSRGVAVDASGNIYVTGFSESMNFPVTKGAYQTGYAGGTSDLVTGDAFLAKYTPGGAIIFITYIGGNRDDIGMGIALDGAGNPYITGYTNSSDFPTTSGAFQPKFGGFVGQGFLLVGGDAFVSELSSDGKSLLYSTYLGGQNDDFGFGIAVDSSSNVYVTGTTISVNFPVSAGAYQTRMAGTGGQEVFPLFGNGLAAIVGGDVFVTKLNPAKSGAAGLVYSTFIGGTDDDVGSSIFVDASGNAYVAGYTLSSNYPTTPGAFQSTWAGAEQQNFFFHFGDAFITKVNPTGTALIFSTYIGGSGDDWISSLAADASGNVIATGSTTSRNFPVTAGSYQTSYHGPTSIPPAVDMFFGDAFLLKLNAGGTALVFSTYFGGAGDDCAWAMTTDAAGNIYLAGFTNSADFPVTAGAFQPTLAGPGYLTTTQTFGDGFLAQFSSSGSPLYVTYLGGTQNDAVASVAITPSGIVYLSGMTKSTDFPTLAAAQPKNASTILSTGLGSNAFVTSISGFFASGTGPSISSVLNATGEAPVIAQNTFIEVKGANLAPDTRTWQTSDFVNNQLPTSLDGVGVTVDGKPGFIYYISPTQVNVLTPLDSTTGPVQVQLKNNLSTSSDATVTMQTYAPGFYQFLPAAYVAAVHLTGALIGPTTLYPGLSTPASPGETIEVYGNGFGQTSPEIVNGSLTAFGTLPVMPTIKVGGIVASVSFAGVVGPGLYQFNVVLPGNLPAGDNSFVATFNGFSTQANALISISK